MPDLSTLQIATGDEVRVSYRRMIQPGLCAT